MTDDNYENDGVAVPSGRAARLARFGGLATSIAGDMLVNGAKAAARGERREMRDLLLTPGNVAKVTDQLSRLRGAAMKVGQLLSMDGGDFLPPELADILAKLRSDARPMPPHQLKAVLNDAWGYGWLSKFRNFETRPLAAASIGQVHRAITRDGRDLAIKIQYPGVAKSIDSDVDNVVALIKFAGLAPAGLNIDPLLAEAKRQLKEEADYQLEGQKLARYRTALAGDDRFLVPELHEDLTTKTVLAMTRVGGDPIEDLKSAEQSVRDHAMTLLMELLFKELFDFRLMQTDPNFANFRYETDENRLVLLDFGAARDISDGLVEGYRRLLTAGAAGDRERVSAIALELGFMSESLATRHADTMADMFAWTLEPLTMDRPYDFGASAIAANMSKASARLAEDRDIQHTPHTEALFLQRKFAGVFLLANRLGAQVNVRDLFMPYAAG